MCPCTLKVAQKGEPGRLQPAGTGFGNIICNRGRALWGMASMQGPPVFSLDWCGWRRHAWIVENARWSCRWSWWRGCRFGMYCINLGKLLDGLDHTEPRTSGLAWFQTSPKYPVPTSNFLVMVREDRRWTNHKYGMVRREPSFWFFFFSFVFFFAHALLLTLLMMFLFLDQSLLHTY